jgi:5-methylcytosine-specific restriction endonuclease McrA
MRAVPSSSADRIIFAPRVKPISELVNLYEDDQLNLEPGFQRQSVWSLNDRGKLIDSILRGYPLPAIFLYRRQEDGFVKFDVIDGKQRLESIFMFMGVMRGNRFEARAAVPGEERADWIDWHFLCRRKFQHLITAYDLNVIEVDGGFSQIVDLFVRINSTGKALTRQEKAHAKYFDSPFLKEADRVARRFIRYFEQGRILTPGQISRMKHVELISELMLSIHKGDVLNKKTALDRVMSAETMDGRSIDSAARLTTSALNRVKRIFPKLRQTRFRQIADFYTLVVLIARFESERLILTDRKRNKLAWDLLLAFSNRIDELREKQRRAQSIDPKQELYREYLLTVQQATDEANQRKTRERILRQLLESLFARKDSQRGFTSEQRRILWNTAAERKCKTCGKRLSWEDFTIDHIDPYSKGGRSRLENAALMCRKHNSAKGNR